MSKIQMINLLELFKIILLHKQLKNKVNRAPWLKNMLKKLILCSPSNFPIIILSYTGSTFSQDITAQRTFPERNIPDFFGKAWWKLGDLRICIF